MSRWPVLTACSTASLMLVVGCAPSWTAGLANAPRLGGGAVADERIDDVVSNGDDACVLFAEGSALRDKVPACPTVERSAGVRHFYVGWPCRRGAHSRDVPAASPLASNASAACSP